MSMYSKITGNDMKYPEEIAEKIFQYIEYNYYSSIQADNDLTKATNCLQWLKTAAENPFNDQMFVTLYDVLSTLTEKIIADQYERKFEIMEE